MKKRAIRFSFAVFVTAVIIGMIIAAGPVEAVILGLSFQNMNSKVMKGENVNFDVSVQIESGEFLNVDYMVLKLERSIKNVYDCDFLKDVQCKFNADGSIVEGCDGIGIELVNTTDNMYGYGYGEGVLKYEITIDTNKFIAGDYKPTLLIYSGENIYETQGADFSIIVEPSLLESCSIRAKDGMMNVDETNLDSKNTINFYVPLNNAKNGKGSITGQHERERLSYKFDIVELLEDNEDYSIIYVNGDYKLGRAKQSGEESLIFFDKTGGKISLCGDHVDVKDMDINYRKGC